MTDHRRPPRGIGGREVEARNRGLCIHCGAEAKLYAQETANGIKGVWWCEQCARVAFGGASWTKLTDEQKAFAPRLPAKKRKCSVCKREAVLEAHHLAPRAQFGDAADKWPLVDICHDCHREWERKTGLGPGATGGGK